MTMAPGEAKLQHAGALLKTLDAACKHRPNPTVVAASHEQVIADSLHVIAHALVGLLEIAVDDRKFGLEEPPE
jgi:hypothetical protein